MDTFLIDRYTDDNGQVQWRQHRVSPSVYLDTCGLRMIAQDAIRANRFSEAIISTNGTLVLSQMSLAEFPNFSPRHGAAVADLIDRMGERLFFQHFDETAVGHAEYQPECNHPDGEAPDGDIELFRWNVEVREQRPGTSYGRAWRDPEFQARANVRQVLLDRCRTLVRQIDETLHWLDNDRKVRAFIVHSMKMFAVRPYATVGLFYTMLMHYMKGRKRNLNDAADLLHAAVPCSYCDFVVLDSSWASRVRQAAAAMRKLGSKAPIARVYGAGLEALDQFLADLEACVPPEQQLTIAERAGPLPPIPSSLRGLFDGRELPPWMAAIRTSTPITESAEVSVESVTVRKPAAQRNASTDTDRRPESTGDTTVLHCSQAAERIQRDYAPWLDLAGDMNRLCVGIAEVLTGLLRQLMKKYEPPPGRVSKEDDQQVALQFLFGRCVTSVQSIMLLVQQGFSGDARIVLRSATESAITMYALDADAGFADKLMLQNTYKSKTMLQAWLQDVDGNLKQIPAESLESWKKDIEFLEQIRPDVKDLREEPIAMEKIAQCVPAALSLYLSIYLPTSVDAADISSLRRWMRVGTPGYGGPILLGPDSIDISNTLSQATVVLGHAARIIIKVFGLTQFEPETRAIQERWTRLGDPAKFVPNGH